MATTVVDNRILVADADTNIGWATHTAHGGNVGIQANDPIRVQGAGSVPLRVNGNGLGGLVFDTGAATLDVTDDHIWVWAFTSHQFESDANNGVIIGFSSSLDGATNAAAMKVGGLDTNIGPIKNFHMWCVDSNRPFETVAPAVLGTPPLLNAVRSLYFNWNFTTNNGRVSAFVDEIRRGNGLTLTGGTSGVPGNSDDVTTLDTTNGVGSFKNVGGIVYVLGSVTIGNSASNVASHFKDVGKVWNFEGQHVSATHHKIKFVGHAGVAIQAVDFGTEVGTGITADGSGGNVFQAGGDSPFRIEAIDANVAVNLFGCQMINAPAVFEDPWRQVQVEDGGVFQTPITRDANDPGANDASPFPGVAATNDHVYFGHNERFDHITINVGTAGIGTYTLSYEFSNGTGWSALVDVTDNTSNLKTTGSNTITYAIPDTWSDGNTVNSVTGKYWIRAVHDAGTRTTSPLITQSSAGIGGGVRAEQANFKAVSGTWTNMSTIRVRNGAILRKITIVDSTTSGKNAAVDLGSANPAANTFRDMTIVGGVNGVLLDGTFTGLTKYDFPNIKFAGQTGSHVRVNFPAAATVQINVLEDGTTPTIVQLNAGTTVNVVNAVVVKITTKNAADSTAIQNARILVEASAGPLPVNAAVTITRATTVASVVHTAHGMANGQKVKVKGADQQEYRGLHVISNVSANGYDYTVSGTPVTPATGTITVTGVILDGVTDVNGILQDTGFDFVSNQPFTGRARKSTASPLFQTAPISGTISSTGADVTVFMVGDE